MGSQAGEAGDPCASPADPLLPERPLGAELGREIRAYCHRQSITARQFIKKAGFSDNGLSMIERAARPQPVTVERVRRITLSHLRFEDIPQGSPRTMDAVRADKAKRAPPVPVREQPLDAARLSIHEQVAREAEASSRRRLIAQQIGHSEVIDALPMTTPAALQAGLIGSPSDAMRALVTAWPALWQRLVSESRAAGQLPGVYFFEAVERGLDALAGEAA